RLLHGNSLACNQERETASLVACRRAGRRGENSATLITCDTKVPLRVIRLRGGKEHLDEQAIGRRRLDDDDQRQAHTSGRKRLRQRYDVEVAGSSSLRDGRCTRGAIGLEVEDFHPVGADGARSDLDVGGRVLVECFEQTGKRRVCARVTLPPNLIRY